MAAAESLNEGRDVLASLHREGRQLKGGDPPLGTGIEGGQILLTERQVQRALHELGGLSPGEAQVFGSDLQQLPSGTPARQGERGIGPRGDHQVKRRGCMIDQEDQRLVNALVLDQVVVVEHQRQRRAAVAQLVDQRHEGGLKRGWRSTCGRSWLPSRGQVRHRLRQSGGQITEEASHVVVGLIQ